VEKTKAALKLLRIAGNNIKLSNKEYLSDELRNISKIDFDNYTDDEEVKSILIENELYKPEKMVSFLIESLFAALDSISSQIETIKVMIVSDAFAILRSVEDELEYVRDNPSSKVRKYMEIQRELGIASGKLKEHICVMISQIRDIDKQDRWEFFKRAKNNKIIIRKFTKSRIYLWSTLSILSLITIFTLATIDMGGVKLSSAFLEFLKDLKIMFFEARLSDRYTFLEVFNSLLVTIALAILTTLIGSFIALFLSFFAAKNLSNERTSKIIKIIVSFIRAIPTILWVLVFSVVANIGVESAIIGMSFHSIAYLIKAYSESIEEIDTGTIDALKATGASWWQIIFQAVLPSTITSILSWTFVRFEINFTNAVAVGAASGAGGIGYDMFMSGTMYFDIREIGVFVYLIFIVALILEFISYFLKNKFIPFCEWIL